MLAGTVGARDEGQPERVDAKQVVVQPTGEDGGHPLAPRSPNACPSSSRVDCGSTSAGSRATIRSAAAATSVGHAGDGGGKVPPAPGGGSSGDEAGRAISPPVPHFG